jgi:hypothetical protein
VHIRRRPTSSIFLALVLAACSGATPSPSASLVPTATPAPAPTPTSTPGPSAVTGVGQAWEALPIFFEPTPLLDGLDHIIAGGSGFVAWGPKANGTELISSGAEATNWGEAGTFGQFDGQRIEAMTSGSAGVIALATDTKGATHVWRSTDGMAWAAVAGASGIDGTVGAMASFGGEYLAGGRAKDGCGLMAWRSADGRSWRASEPWPGTVAACSDTPLVLGLRAGTGGLVAFGIVRGNGGAGDAFWTSSDGLTWAIHPQPSLGGNVAGFTAAGPGYVAVGASGAPPHAVVWTSTNGATWTPVADQAALQDAYMADVATVADGTLVAVGTARDATGGAFHFAAWTSADGLTWQRAPGAVNSNDPGPYSDDASVTVRQLASDGQRLVAIGAGTNGVWVSPRVTPGLRTATLDVTLLGRLVRPTAAVPGTCREALNANDGTLLLTTVTAADSRTYALNFTVASDGHITGFIFYGDPVPDIDPSRSGQLDATHFVVAPGSTGTMGALDFHDLTDISASGGPMLAGSIRWICGA